MKKGLLMRSWGMGRNLLPKKTCDLCGNEAILNAYKNADKSIMAYCSDHIEKLRPPQEYKIFVNDTEQVK